MIELTDENKAKIAEMAERLEGTCNSLNDELNSTFGDEDLSTDAALYLDSLVMECEQCNWWCEPSELNDDQICADCAIGDWTGYDLH